MLTRLSYDQPICSLYNRCYCVAMFTITIHHSGRWRIVTETSASNTAEKANRPEWNSPVCTRSIWLLTPCLSTVWELFVWGSHTRRSGCTTLLSGSAAWGGQRKVRLVDRSNDLSTFLCIVRHHTSTKSGGCVLAWIRPKHVGSDRVD